MRLPSLEQSQPGLYEELTFNFLPDDPVVTVRHSTYSHSKYSHSKYNFLSADPVVTVRHSEYSRSRSRHSTHNFLSNDPVVTVRTLLPMATLTMAALTSRADGLLSRGYLRILACPAP